MTRDAKQQKRDPSRNVIPTENNSRSTEADSDVRISRERQKQLSQIITIPHHSQPTVWHGTYVEDPHLTVGAGHSNGWGADTGWGQQQVRHCRSEDKTHEPEGTAQETTEKANESFSRLWGDFKTPDTSVPGAPRKEQGGRG